MEMKTLKGYKKFKTISAWTIVDNYCLTRYKLNGDINNVEDRVAFIEKTPRVKTHKISFHKKGKGEYGATYEPNNVYWISGDKGDSYSELEGEDKSSCEWCDKMLELLGYE